MGIANIINNSTTTSGGEIIRELVNASDGAGLHFDGSAGYIDIASPPDLGTKFSFEFVIKADSWGDAFGIIDFGTGGRFLFFADSTNNDNLAIYDTDYRDFGVAVLDDLKVHHLTLTVDGTAATLYDNGNLVGTTTLGAAPTVDACADAKIGSNFAGTNSFIDGTIYRARVYNRTLSADDVRTAFERADVDFSSQYGSQTELITSSSNRDFASGTGNWGANGITLVNDSGLLKVQQTAAYNPSNDLATFANGRLFLQKYQFSNPPNDKRYRLTLSAKATTSGSKLYFNFQAGSTTDISLNQVVTLTDSLATYSFDILPTLGNEPDYILLGLDTAETYWIDNVSLVRTGCVSDYDLAFANPTQSLTVQDRAGAADGTASTSGVTQVQPVVQLNSTSARIGTSAATPADGEVVADTVSVTGTGHDAAKITITNTSNANARLLLNSGHGNWSVCNSDTIGDALEFRDESAGATRLSINSTGQVQIQQNASDLSGASALKVTGTAYGTNKTIEAYMSTASATKSLIYAENSSGAVFNVRGDGLAEFSGGIAFQSATTGSGTGAGYTLENYEYGTFTMGLSGTTATIPSGYETARYYRIGNLVWISWYSDAMTLASSAGNAKLTGLPFNVANNNANYTPFIYQHGNAVDGNSRGGYFEKNLTQMTFIDDGATTAASFIDGSNRYIMVTGVYETDDA